MAGIKVDIDKERIRESVIEVIKVINEYYQEECIERSNVLYELNNILKSGRVSVTFFLNLQNKYIPDLRMTVDPRRKKFLLRSRHKKRIKPLNTFVRSL